MKEIWIHLLRLQREAIERLENEKKELIREVDKLLRKKSGAAPGGSKAQLKKQRPALYRHHAGGTRENHLTVIK